MRVLTQENNALFIYLFIFFQKKKKEPRRVGRRRQLYLLLPAGEHVLDWTRFKNK